MSSIEKRPLIDVEDGFAETTLHEKTPDNAQGYVQSQTKGPPSKATIKTLLCVILNILSTVTLVFTNKL